MSESKEDLIAKLSPIEYAVTQENATERPLQGLMMIFMKKGSMWISSAANRYSLRQISMMLVVDGLLFEAHRPQRNQRKQISLMACTVSKSAVKKQIPI